MKKQARVAFVLAVLIFVFGFFVNSESTYAASADGVRIVEQAREYIGKVPYVWGGNVIDGNNPGADCSGFICRIYEKFGYNLWPNRTALRNCGTNLGTDLSCAQPGDIIWFTGHVGIYSGVNSRGQHMIVHETGGSYQNVIESPIEWVRAELMGIIRIPGVTVGGSTTPITVSATWSEYPAQFSVGTNNATLSRTVSLNGAMISSVTTVGIELYNYDGSKQLASKSEKPYPLNGVINMWYNVNEELGIYLTPAGKYQYVFFATLADGTHFRSDVYTITTQGTHVHSDEYKGVETAHPHKTIMSCEYCGEVYYVSSSANYTEIKLPAVSATCETSGFTEGSKCSVCNEIIVAQQEVSAKGHSYKSAVVKKSTCTSTGIMRYTCSVCQGTYDEIIAMTEHKVVVDKAVAPTTMTTGLTEGSHCSECKAVIVAQQVIPVKEAPTPAPVTPPTDDFTGQVRNFVSRMYTIALGRGAEEKGLKDWTERLLSHEVDGAGIAHGFIMSDEFTKRNLSDREFVDVLYRTFFNREADAGGRANWLAALAAGKTRGYVLSGFVNSTEFDRLCDSYGIARGTMREDGSPVNPGIRSFVERCYTKVLGREGEKAGIEDWTNRIATGQMSAEDVAKSFFFSDEYTNKKTSNETFVETLYQTFMGRASDPAGKSDWVGRLNRGTSRQEVLEGFSRSTEFAGILQSFGL